MNIFRRQFIKCFYCKKKIEKKKAFSLQYTASDGVGTIQMCPDCSKELDQLVNKVKGLYDE
jgi:hypothetical protein